MTTSFIADGVEVVLPVTPSSFGWGAGKAITTVTVNGAGDVPIPGDPTVHSDKLYCLFPARSYPFLAPGAVVDPYHYVTLFEGWAREKTRVRYIQPGAFNKLVLVEEITYQEQDGTGDVYATLYLRDYPILEAVTTQVSNSDTGNSSRTDSGTESGENQYYTVVSGDCLSVICRRYYGSGTAAYYNAVAKYNGISNPHLIYPGQVIALPPVGQLGVSG